MELAQDIVLGAGAYAGIGMVFALAFVMVGVGKVDEGAKDAGFLFRVLIFPAAAALWPVMLVKWIAAPKAKGHA